MSSDSSPKGRSSRTASPTPSATSSGRVPPTGSTLSKESLYAPLTSYIPRQTTDGNAISAPKSTTCSSSGNKAKYRGIAPAIRESSLIDHLTTISATYNHCPTTSFTLRNTQIGAGLGKNNGGQGLRRRAFEDRISQRSLVLVGGGLMTGVVGTAGVLDDATGEGGEASQFLSKSAVEVSRVKRRKRKRERGYRVRGSISNRERKRRLKEVEDREAAMVQIKGGGAGKSVHEKTKGPTSSSSPHKARQQNNNFTTGALLALNGLWNDYIHKLLGLEQGKDSTVQQLKPPAKGKNNIILPRPRTSSEISIVLSSAELIGAYVKITRCDPARSYIGKEGIVVDTTANTWRIAIPSAPANTASCGKNDAKDGTSSGGATKINKHSTEKSEEEKEVPLTSIWKERIVPKHKSELAFCINLEGDGTVEGIGDTGAEATKRTWNIIIKG